jgi:hypothetical protein
LQQKWRAIDAGYLETALREFHRMAAYAATKIEDAPGVAF